MPGLDLLHKRARLTPGEGSAGRSDCRWLCRAFIPRRTIESNPPNRLHAIPCTL